MEYTQRIVDADADADEGEREREGEMVVRMSTRKRTIEERFSST